MEGLANSLDLSSVGSVVHGVEVLKRIRSERRRSSPMSCQAWSPQLPTPEARLIIAADTEDQGLLGGYLLPMLDVLQMATWRSPKGRLSLSAAR